MVFSTAIRSEVIKWFEKRNTETMVNLISRFPTLLSPSSVRQSSFFKTLYVVSARLLHGLPSPLFIGSYPNRLWKTRFLMRKPILITYMAHFWCAQSDKLFPYMKVSFEVWLESLRINLKASLLWMHDFNSSIWKNPSHCKRSQPP